MGAQLITLERLRLVAILLALSLILGELWRSWGVGRPVAFVIDDMIMGALLIFSAIAITQDTTRRRAFFAAAWGLNAGMLYGSFFGKVFAPEAAEAGNWNLGILTALVGLAFIVACAGTVASIWLPRE